MRIGLLADDLTGASDTGLAFHRAGLRTWVLPRTPAADLPLPPDLGVLAVNTASRNVSASEAVARSRMALRWLQDRGAPSVYLKVDSTLRGTLAPVAAALRRDLGAELAVVAPAFPGAGRLTLGGYQIVDGVPVSESPYARDPLSPVGESHLPTLLAEAADRVALVEWRTVREGEEAIARALGMALRERARLVAVDAARPEDMRAIARAIHRVPFLVLPVGSAGLAQALAAVWPAPRLLGGGRGPTTAGPVLAVSGSVNPVSLAQIAALPASVRRVRVDVSQLLLTGTEELESLVRQVLQGLVAQRDVVLTTAETTEQVARDQALASDLGMTRLQLGQFVTEALGELAKRVVAAGDVTNLVLVGGETSAAVCERLGAGGFEIESELLPAIPSARVIEGGLRLVTKSGGFGAPDALDTLIAMLRGSPELQRPGIF